MFEPRTQIFNWTPRLPHVQQRIGAVKGAAQLNRALWMEIDGLYRMSELPPLPETPPHDSGFPGLAPHFRLRPGDVTVVTGIPGHGKTTVVNDIACRMVERHKWRVAFASFEQIRSATTSDGCGPGTPAVSLPSRARRN